MSVVPTTEGNEDPDFHSEAEADPSSCRPVPPSRAAACCKAVVSAWNPWTNLKDLVHRSSKAVPQLDGIRLAACIWVIAFHSTYETRAYLSSVAGPNEEEVKHIITERLNDTWFFAILGSGDLAVDIFFVLSGFLIAYILHSEVDRWKGKGGGRMVDWLLCRARACGGIKYWRFLSRRWLRLMPVYMVSTLTMLVTPLTWEICQKWWWANLLLISNYVGPGTSVFGCVGQGWSIAVEAQFYVVSPLFVFLSTRPWLHQPGKGKLRGHLVYCCLLFVSILFRLILLVGFDWNFDSFGKSFIPGDTEPMPEERTVFYTKTYARVGPYALGMLLAYFYRYNLRHKEKVLVGKHPELGSTSWRQGGRRWRGCCRRCDGREVFAGYINIEEAAICPMRWWYKERRKQEALSASLSVNAMQRPLMEREGEEETEHTDDAQLDSTEVEKSEDSDANVVEMERRCGSGLSLTLWIMAGAALLALPLYITTVWPQFGGIITYISQSSVLSARRFMFICGRTIFAGTVALFILLCLIRLGTWFDAVASWKPWAPLARLTYSAYLFQFLAMAPTMILFRPMADYFYPGLAEAKVLDEGQVVSMTIGIYFLGLLLTLVVDFILSLIVYLIFEKPFMNLRMS